MATAISYETILKPVGRALIYNPGKRLERQVAGETYHIPSKHERYVDVLRENGRIKHVPQDEQEYLETLPSGVRPIVDTVTQKNGSQNPNVRDTIALPVGEILGILLGDDGRQGTCGVWGVRILFGDRRDEAVIKEANETYRKRLFADAIAKTAAHRAQNDKYSKLGLPPSPPTPELLELYKIEAEMKRGAVGTPCKVCFLPVTDAEAMVKHLNDFHALDEAQVPPAPPTGPEDEAVEAPPARRGPGRPPKSAVAQP